MCFLKMVLHVKTNLCDTCSIHTTSVVFILITPVASCPRFQHLLFAEVDKSVRRDIFHWPCTHFTIYHCQKHSNLQLCFHYSTFSSKLDREHTV